MNQIAISCLLCGLLIFIINMLFQGIDHEKSFVIKNKVNTSNKNKAYSIISLVCIIQLIIIGTTFGIMNFSSDSVNIMLSSFCMLLLSEFIPIIHYSNIIK